MLCLPQLLTRPVCLASCHCLCLLAPAVYIDIVNRDVLDLLSLRRISEHSALDKKRPILRAWATVNQLKVLMRLS